jgi:hypothetical protein
MSVSRSALELTEVRCFCPAGTQGHAVLQLRPPLRLLKAKREDVARILIREGLAHPYVCGSLGCPKRKAWVPSKPTCAASHRDASRTTGRSALQRRCDLEAAAKGQQTKSKGGQTTIEPVAADPRPDRVERLSVHIHGLASRAAGVCMIRPTTSPAGRAAVLLN